MDDTMKNLKYHYLNKKIIEVSMKEKIKINTNEEEITILKNKGNTLKFELNSQKKTISDIIKLLDADNILDMNISSIPLEDIITKIYKGEKQTI